MNTAVAHAGLGKTRCNDCPCHRFHAPTYA